jgi:pre-mRNA cleavage complex 2 protein Pcf11
MYLLDSICKNLGSPYPQLFQRNIYRTFMDAYTLVEPPVRRKLEELMSTWKEPPSTGIYPNPVFPQDVTRKIENALLKAKTVALQLEQRRQREMAAAGLLQHRNTPPLPFPQQHQPDWSGNPVRAHNYSLSKAYSSQNVVNAYPHITSGPPLGQPGPSNQDILLTEIRHLLSSVSQTLLLNPGDEAAKTQGAALDQLQRILQTSVLPYDQIEAVRLQLASLPISQQRPPQTSTPPIVDISPPAQDRNTESLLNSLRAAGLLGVPASSTSAPQIPTIQPLAVNANAANLRNSDLELTSTSLQK